MIFKIGRDIDCDIVINSNSVSLHHLIIKKENNEWYFIDNDSTNGTYLNSPNNRVYRGKLKRDNKLYLAKYILYTNEIFDLIDSKNSKNRAIHNQDILIGRDSSVDMVISNPNISWHHAKITNEDGRYYIYDLNSTNGTFVNNKAVRDKEEIREGDKITLGLYSFIFTIDNRGSKLVKSEKYGIRVDVKDISFSVNTKGKEKILLDDINFTIYPSEMVAIMGLSGAGKTTLLNILSGYLKPTKGEVLINGRDLYQNYESIKNFIGYVPQEDIIHPELTVYESLFYSSKLRLSSDLRNSEINQRIDEVLKELGIYNTKNVLIGSPQIDKGISGGERKRVNIAMELLANPELIFLDEPTSGLSSVDTRIVINRLKKLSDSGKTVLLTIHQPSLTNYKKIDNVIILTHGEIAYFGSNYPQSIEFFNKDRPKKNILDDPDNALIGLHRGEKEGKNWKEIYKHSKIYREFIEDRAINDKEDSKHILKKNSNNSSFSQFFILTKRYLNIKLKDRVNTTILFIQAPIIAMLLIFLFSGNGYEQYKETPSILLFILIISSIWFGVINSVREIVSEKAICKRERQFGLKIVPYVLSKFSILTILSLIQVTLLILLVNIAVPLNINLINTILIVFLTAVTGVSIGLLISSSTKSSTQALALVPAILIPMIIFAGGMVSIKDMPTNRLYIDAYRVSMLMPTRWSFEELLREYDNYNRDQILGLREPKEYNCEEFNITKYPSYICKDEYNALYPNDIDFEIEGCEGRRCIEDKYIDLIDGIWRNSLSWIIYTILILYTILTIFLAMVRLKLKDKN